MFELDDYKFINYTNRTLVFMFWLRVSYIIYLFLFVIISAIFLSYLYFTNKKELLMHEQLNLKKKGVKEFM